MTANDTLYPRLELVINTFSDWLKHRREINEMRQLENADLERIAGDLRISAGDLEELVRQGPHAADELPRLLKTLGRVDLLILDDWGLSVLTANQRIDLLEILEDRQGRGSTLVTSQIPVDQWHDAIGDPTLADAILDRLVHNAHRLALTGDSMRRLSGHRELDAQTNA